MNTVLWNMSHFPAHGASPCFTPREWCQELPWLHVRARWWGRLKPQSVGTNRHYATQHMDLAKWHISLRGNKRPAFTLRQLNNYSQVGISGVIVVRGTFGFRNPASYNTGTYSMCYHHFCCVTLLTYQLGDNSMDINDNLGKSWTPPQKNNNRQLNYYYSLSISERTAQSCHPFCHFM